MKISKITQIVTLVALICFLVGCRNFEDGKLTKQIYIGKTKSVEVYQSGGFFYKEQMQIVCDSASVMSPRVRSVPLGKDAYIQFYDNGRKKLKVENKWYVIHY